MLNLSAPSLRNSRKKRLVDFVIEAILFEKCVHPAMWLQGYQFFFKIYRNVILEKFLEPALITGKIAKPP